MEEFITSFKVNNVIKYYKMQIIFKIQLVAFLNSNSQQKEIKFNESRKKGKAPRIVQADPLKALKSV